MKWGVVGFGSVGQRHAENIKSLGDEVLVCSKNRDCRFDRVESIHELFLQGDLGAVLLCNSTGDHYDTYLRVRDCSAEIPVLIEKPIFDRSYELPQDDHVYVAYCFRFHNLVRIVKGLIQKKAVIAARFYVGQYLPHWRPNRDYRETYSASRESGGGVLRDLSHELDLAQHLLGDLELKHSRSDTLSDLKISSDDYFAGLLSARQCPSVTVEMNYLDRISQRVFTLFTNEETVQCDFIQGVIQVNAEKRRYEIEPNHMYLEMLAKFRKNDFSLFPGLEEALSVVKLIEKAEG